MLVFVVAKLKSERHHWWPECVSAHWADAGGCVNWLLPDGTVRRAPPKNFGVIGNGHFIKLGSNPEEGTVWDENFEPVFHRADSNFPQVIDWLEGLGREARPNAMTCAARYMPQAASDEQIGCLVEGLVSLAVRSPMNRQAAVALAEDMRGPLPERERNVLIGANMRDAQRRAVAAIGTRGKFVVIYSPEREFIFGDGFFHNLTSPSAPPSSPKMLVPLTPRISVLYARPRSYRTEPRLVTLVVRPEETGVCNETIQVYAKDMLFYRTEKPAISRVRLGKAPNLCAVE